MYPFITLPRVHTPFVHLVKTGQEGQGDSPVAMLTISSPVACHSQAVTCSEFQGLPWGHWYHP